MAIEGIQLSLRQGGSRWGGQGGQLTPQYFKILPLYTTYLIRKFLFTA